MHTAKNGVRETLNDRSTNRQKGRTQGGPFHADQSASCYSRAQLYLSLWKQSGTVSATFMPLCA